MKPHNVWHLLPLWREILAPVIATATAIWTWFKYRHAHSWPSVQGRISGAQVHRGRNSYFKPWVASLTYTYIVNGEYFAGSRPLGARSERKAEAKIDGWKDRMVVVRYSSEHPEISTLLKSDQPGGQLGN
jgi:hypothetical protein